MSQPLMIDLFCGRGGWTKGFLERGWRVRGYDLNPQPDYPKEAEFVQANILYLTAEDLMDADAICCSSPCEEFSVHCMKHFHPNPKFPEMGIKLFNHSREICEASGKPYVMENVRCAEKFVGRAVTHCGPFYFWGNGVPAIMPSETYRVSKGFVMGRDPVTGKRLLGGIRATWSGSKAREIARGKSAEIPASISTYIAETMQLVTAEICQ